MKITDLQLSEGATAIAAPLEKAAAAGAAHIPGSPEALRTAAGKLGNKTGSYSTTGAPPVAQSQATPTMTGTLPGVTAGGAKPPANLPAATTGTGAYSRPQTTATPTSVNYDASIPKPAAGASKMGLGKKVAAATAATGLGYQALKGDSGTAPRDTSAPPATAPGEQPAGASSGGLDDIKAAPTAGRSQADLAAMHTQAVKTGNAASSPRTNSATTGATPTSTAGGATAGGSFADAFKAARAQHGGPGGKFTWNGKEYQTNVKGEPYVPNPVPAGQKSTPTPTTTAGSVSATSNTPAKPQGQVTSTVSGSKPTTGMGPVQAATVGSGAQDDVTGVDAAVAANAQKPTGGTAAPTTPATATTQAAPTVSPNNPFGPKTDPKIAAWEKLSPAQQKWMGGADPTDPYITARMKKAVPDEQPTPPTTNESLELDMLRKFSGIAEAKMSDLKGRTHKGSYGTEYDTDKDGNEKKKAPAAAEKRGRGRPKKDADSSGEVKKYDSSALSAAFGGGKKPKKEVGKVSKKHTLKDWVESIDEAKGKKADKDYDKDGKIETGAEEHAGSVDNAIKKSKETVKEGVNKDLIFSLLKKLDNPMNPRGFNIAHAVERGDRETLENIISRHINHDDEFQNVPHRHKMELRDACMEHYLNPAEIEEGFAVAAPQYQPGETVYFRGKPGQVDRIEGEKCFVLLKTGDMDVWPTSQVSKEPQSMFSTFKKDATDIGKGLKGFLTGKSEVDESPFAYAAHQAKAHGDEHFSLGGKTFNVKESKDIQLESWNSQLESLLGGKESLTESVTISTTSGDQGGDTVTVNATDNDAHEILALLRNAGMGGLHRNDDAPSQSPYGAPMTQGQGDEEGGELDAELVSVSPEVMDNGDDMLSLLKKMTTTGHAHVGGEEEQGQPGDYEDEEGSEEHGHEGGEEEEQDSGEGQGSEEEEVTDEANDGNLANNAKPYDKVTQGDVVAGRKGEDEEGGKAEEDQVEENLVATNTQTGEEYKLDETGMDMVPDDPDMNTGALKEEDSETCESCGEKECGCHQLEEGDAEYANSDDNQATQDLEYMMNVISGGLNGKKTMYKHNYKGGDNPMAMHESEDLLSAFKKLSGIK